MKTKFGPKRMHFPLPTILIVTGNMEYANIVTIAWITMLTGTPPTLGISVGSKGFSHILIKENKNFTVNIATAEIMKETDFCGLYSGDDYNKFEKTGLTRLPSTIISSPIIKECPVNIECKLVETRMSGKTYNFSGEILETHIDTDKLKDTTKSGSIDINAINPLIYYSGAREYWSLGEKLADAYKIGKIE